MHSFGTKRLRRMVVGTVTTLVLLALAAGPVLADTEMGHTGTVGAHSLRDTSANPGVTCTYGEHPANTFPLDKITVRAPRVKAIDKTGAVDRQRVGWRFIIKQAQQQMSGGPSPTGVVLLVTIYKSPIQKAPATDSQNASFSSMSKSFTNPESQYHVFIKMFWYRGDGSTQGTATHMVDFYLATGAGVEDRTDPFCNSSY